MGKEYIECKSRKDLLKEIYTDEWESRIPLTKNKRQNISFDGFHYFAPNNMNSPDVAKFVISREGNDPNDITGVVKLGIYNSYGELPDFWASCYSDVRRDKQKQGTITRLFGALNKFLTPNDYLVGTSLSKIGKKADLHNLRKRIVTICPVFDDDVDFYKYCIKKSLLKKSQFFPD